jgi:2-polyprenyl-3-methyl-5-hydroxy-6-metoxy-1,4-benzoquinol methylase
MNWKEFWNNQAKENDPKAQVSRLISGILHPDELMDKIANKIANQIQLKPNDVLLDVCCGNGILTRKLALKCNSVIAIDFSEVLIKNAQRTESSNITWICEDASNFKLSQQFDKIVLYFSFQYFESNQQALKVIESLKLHLKPDGILLIGDIPDADFKWKYYDTFPKRFFAIWSKLKGKNNMGRFWRKSDLVKLCSEIDLKSEIQKQETWQPYSWYRFDLVAYSKK